MKEAGWQNTVAAMLRWAGANLNERAIVNIEDGRRDGRKVAFLLLGLAIVCLVMAASQWHLPRDDRVEPATSPEALGLVGRWGCVSLSPTDEGLVLNADGSAGRGNLKEGLPPMSWRVRTKGQIDFIHYGEEGEHEDYASCPYYWHEGRLVLGSPEEKRGRYDECPEMKRVEDAPRSVLR